MKLISVIKKSLVEQLRNVWILILTITMAPFFVAIYYVILGTYQPHYDLLLLNRDTGIMQETGAINYGTLLVDAVKASAEGDIEMPLTVRTVDNRQEALQQIRNRKSDALVIIPENFSGHVQNTMTAHADSGITVEFVGDLTNFNYMISAVWANEMVEDYLSKAAGKTRLIRVKETALGMTGAVDEFDLYVPGLLILAIIMIMFSATIAVVSEVEHKTMMRLKFSRLTAFDFLAGVSCVQVIVGIVSILLALLVALMLGFDFRGSFAVLLLITVLTSVSIIAFSLIVAAATKTVNEVLIVGNFPLLLFMFFTGAAFPLRGGELFTIAGYPVSIQGFMSPTHAVSALNKVMIMNMGITDILPEIIALIILTAFYFLIGWQAFSYRHMKVE